MGKNQGHKNQQGFTLIELLVVLSILGILSTIGISKFYVYKANSYNAVAKAGLRNAITAQESAYAQNQTYASCADALACKAALPGFSPTLNPDGSSAMSVFTMEGNADSFSGEAQHGKSTSLYTFDSAVGTMIN